jgi:hypothetical protein
VRQALEDVGRDPTAFGFTIFGARPDEPSVQRARDAEVDEVVFAVESNEPARVLEDLESTAEFVRRIS